MYKDRESGLMTPFRRCETFLEKKNFEQIFFPAGPTARTIITARTK